MKIRVKIILVVLPILAASLLATGIISSYAGRSAITKNAMKTMGFKAQLIANHMESQWNLLTGSGYQEQEESVNAAKNGIISYALNSIVKNDSELVFAVNNDFEIELSTSSVSVSEEEKAILDELVKSKKTGWVEFSLDGKQRVGSAVSSVNFGLHVFMSEDEAKFYAEINTMTRQTIIVLSIALAFAGLFLGIFTVLITSPLTRVVNIMRNIITTNDMDQRVEVQFKDEIGHLAHTFNIMISELQKAYQQIKEFAFQSVLAKKNEQKVRQIFQKYVPKDVIEGIFANPESMLVGDNRVVAILFSDIRSFTTISEGYMPDELVKTLNRYFEFMVEIIMNHGGVIDKYIGDAIMAIFGAPVKHDNDATQAVEAALEMQKRLHQFNDEQVQAGKPKFITGIGINYGVVTVGNIGSERKMDYTVIGDMVNLASRLEGMTKLYHQEVIFSESMYRKVKEFLPCRWVDKVVAKGKTTGENIYTVKENISAREQKGWTYYHAAQKFYYGRHFKKAIEYFSAVLKLMPNDYLSEMFIERSKQYLKHPPGDEWIGLEVLDSK